MSIKGKSKKKKRLENRDRAAEKKITMIVLGSTVVLVFLLYLMLSNV